MEDVAEGVDQGKENVANARPQYANIFCLAGAGLGWHNCDQSLAPPPGLFVRLVLRNGRSVMRGGQVQGNVHCENLPVTVGTAIARLDQ